MESLQKISYWQEMNHLIQVKDKVYFPDVATKNQWTDHSKAYTNDEILKEISQTDKIKIHTEYTAHLYTVKIDPNGQIHIDYKERIK